MGSGLAKVKGKKGAHVLFVYVFHCSIDHELIILRGGGGALTNVE